MNRLFYIVLLAFMLLHPPCFSAKTGASGLEQAPTSPAMADAMRDNGKIYVVVGIIMIVLAGLFVYLFLIERKVKRLEGLLHEREGQTK